MSANHTTGRIKSGDVEIFYRQFGTPGKTPVIIVHGLSFFSYDWIETATLMAKDREVVAIDMRGFGESDWSPTRDYKLESMSNDVVSRARRAEVGQGGADGPFLRRTRLPRHRRLEAGARRCPRLRRLRTRSRARPAASTSPSASAVSRTCSPRSTRP